MIERRFRCVFLFVGFCCFCIQIGKAQEARLFSLSRFSGALSSIFQMTDESLDSFGIIAQDTNRKLLQAGIEINTVGSIYHPNLLTFRVYLNLVGLNSKRRFFADESINKSLNNSYDINLAFFKKKALSLELFTLSNFSSADRAFLERYFTTVHRTGFRILSRMKYFPFRLEASKGDMVSESEVFRERDERTEKVDFRSTLLDSEKAKSILTLRWKDYSEAVYDVDYQSLEALTNFLYSYGSKQRNRLSSLLTFHRLSGDFDIRRLQFNTNALQYLKRGLYLNGNYIFNWDNSFSRGFTRHRLTGSVSHELYQSLTTSVLAGGRLEDSSFQRIRGFQYQVSANYRKKIPTGRIQFQFMNRQENVRFESRNGLIQTSEVYDFSLSDTIILTRPGIDRNSIRVTDTDFSFVYLEGVDYQVDIINDTVVISRLPGGAIDSEMKVLVLFEYLTFPDFRLKSRFYLFNFRLVFLKFFHGYYNRTSNTNTVFSDYLVPPFESYVKNQIGGKFDTRFLSVEYFRERRESNLTNYVSWNLRATAGIRLFRSLNLSGHLIWNQLKYQPEVFFTNFHARSAEVSFIPRYNITTRLIYRKILYSTNVFERTRESILVKFDWKIRKITIFFFYDHLFNRTANTLRLRNYLNVGIRRNF